MHYKLSDARVLYLDFDGVLHPDDVYQTRHGIVLRAPGHRLFEGSPTLEALLAEHEDVRIVLATSWVRFLSFSRALKQLSPAMQERVVGATFHTDMLHRAGSSAYMAGARLNDTWLEMGRYKQIASHVSRHEVKNWLAIDDMVENWPEHHLPNLAATQSAVGILDDPAVQLTIQRWLAVTRL